MPLPTTERPGGAELGSPPAGLPVAALTETAGDAGGGANRPPTAAADPGRSRRRHRGPYRYGPGGRRGSRRTTPPSSTAPTTRNGQPIPAWQPKNT